MVDVRFTHQQKSGRKNESVNRQADLKEELIKLFDKNEKYNEVQNIIAEATGIKNIREMLA